MANSVYKWFGFSWLLPFVFWLPGNPSPSGVSVKETLSHPFYIGVTEINHNLKEKTLEISCKMFAEDIELTLEKNYKTTLDISAAKDKASFDKFIPDYINKHLTITVDGKPAALSFVGFEVEKESVFCYFEIENISAPKKLDLNNSILYDFAPEQINIMHVVVGGKRESTKLTYPDRTAGFSF